MAKHLCNTCAVLILDMESIRCRILCQIEKLNFLKRLLEERATGVGAVAMRSLSDDMESLCLVKECRELELNYGTNLTDIVLMLILLVDVRSERISVSSTETSLLRSAV